jgi:PAS domain S-box-containing protein
VSISPEDRASNQSDFSLSRWVLPGLLAALGTLYVFQARMILKNAGGDSTSRTIADNMQARANGISLAVMSYLQNHDSDSLGRIESEGKEASRLLEELRQEGRSQGTSRIWDPVVKAHEEMRKATLSLLAVDHEVTKNRQAFAAGGEALIAIMISRMEPSIKPTQLNSSARLESTLAAASEARSITKNPDDVNGILASQRRFNVAVQRYAKLSRTQRAERWAEEAVSLFDQCVKQAQALQRAEALQQAALTRYTEKKNVFDVVLQESRSSHTEGLTLNQIFSPETGVVAAGAVLLVIGMLYAIWPSRGENMGPMPRLQNLLSCVEAAATGDVSRLPIEGPPDEIGLLARSVGRLIQVLARSENLVYHLAALVESSGDAIVSHTLDGSVLSWNKGAQRIYGYSADEMKGQSISILAPEDHTHLIDDYLKKLRQGKRVLPFETLHRAKNGRSVCALVRVSAIYDSTRRVIGASFSAQEMTDATAAPSKAIQENEVI